MANDEFLAHSPKGCIPSQTYANHVENVRYRALSNAHKASAFFRGDVKTLVAYIEAAAIYHDLGKLDTANQEVLKKESRKPLVVAHEDAGVCRLDQLGQQEAAILVHSHHAGLFSRSQEIAKQGRPFRDLQRTTPSGELIADHVDLHLDQYELCHVKAGCPVPPQTGVVKLDNCGFTRRIALSCLVDADHADTARHYHREPIVSSPRTRWLERLAALERYVANLPEGKEETERSRNQLRKRLFEACRLAPITPATRTCDAPVGTGKTTAVMSHLLNVAANKKPRLRHVIVVLPYTNIINQTVEVYRKALVLEGEHPQDVVAEHHHRADFADSDLRHLATLWKAPIIVTTAVQFFETLGAYHPASLRKLHELPGSAVFVDEMHTSIPSHLWPQVWRWLESWTRDWGGHLVLASGSLPRFWDLAEYKKLISTDKKGAIHIPDLVIDCSLRDQLQKAEKQRINYRRRPKDADALDLSGTVNFVLDSPGPRLLIVNTVQTAAVIAQHMRTTGHDVLHLSTALAPAHRELVAARIKLRLREGVDDWTLVATSCVEAGMDFSFRTGFRERASTASLIQIGGRVNRGAEYLAAEVWDILLRDNLFRDNLSMTISRRALGSFSTNDLGMTDPTLLATKAMQREWTSGAEERAIQLVQHEDSMEYPSVAEECKVIEARTRTVLIDQSLVQAIRCGSKVSRTELIRYSVQLWATKISKLALESVIPGNKLEEASIYSWPHDYDPDFLGYMKGVLRLDEFIKTGGGII